MLNDLQTKLKKYEAKVVQCEKTAREATDQPRREFYEGLSR